MKMVYPKLKTNPILMKYVPDSEGSNYPDKEYFYTVLATTYPIETKDLVKQARSNRAITAAHKEKLMVEIKEDIKNEIMAVLTQKCKYYLPCIRCSDQRKNLSTTQEGCNH